MTRRISAELTRSGARFLPLAYEDLFGRPATTAELDRIAEHFGLPPFRSEEETSLATMLEQGERQAALSALYRNTADLRNLDVLFGERFGCADRA